MAYEIHYDSSGEHLEPTIGHCEKCGFNYSEHIKLSERDQVLMFRLALREEEIELNWDEIFGCDKIDGYFKAEKKTKINLRVNDKYPHHAKITVFVNGANCGNLCLRIEEFDVICELLAMGIFHIPIANLQISIGSYQEAEKE